MDVLQIYFPFQDSKTETDISVSIFVIVEAQDNLVYPKEV